MLDKEYIQLQKEAEKYSHELLRFKKEWFATGIEIFTWPTLGYKGLTNEFIIQVPLATDSKVQYLPFIYGGLAVEIKA